MSEVAKYDWKQLEKEYILGNYKSVSSFLKDKEIPINGSTKKSTKGWKNKKVRMKKTGHGKSCVPDFLCGDAKYL